jgi:Secretion system C-terminal sorting domain
MKKSLLLFGLLLFAGFIWAQTAPIILKWDKTGCQANLVDQINFDSNFTTATCLKVCRNSMMNYRLIGIDMTTIATIEWTITGGEIETNQEFAIINWDDTNSGTIDIKLIFVDNTVIQRSICVEKIDSQLILAWDRIGCQAEENNISEIKFSNISLSIPCLKVCKDTKPIFSLNGDNLTNIQTIQWLVTGGVAETPNDFKTAIAWDATNTGFITVRIKYFTNTIVQKTICVNKINSSLLLEWEKIDENTVHEIKLVNTDANKESIVVYDDSTVDYTIKGSNKNTISTVSWEVIGGFTETDSGFTVPVTWTDENIKELIAHITYVDGTTANENFAVISKAAIVDPPPLPPNAISFSYDNAGNQIRRTMIYIAPPLPRKANSVATPITEDKLLPTDLYEEIKYYPNPVKSELFVKWSEIDNNDLLTIELYDLNGRLMRSLPNQSNQENATIDFESYPTGYYNLMLLYKTGEPKSLKIVKQ